MSNDEEDEGEDVIPVWGSPVETVEAMQAFAKVARYWKDNGAADDMRCTPVHPPSNVGDFIEQGLGFLWYFVIDKGGHAISEASKDSSD